MEKREALEHLQDTMKEMMALSEVPMPEKAMFLTDMGKAFEMLEAAEKTRAEIFTRVRAHLAQTYSLDGDWAKGIDALKRLLDAQDRMAGLAKDPQPENRQWREADQNALKENRRAGSDMDKYFKRASKHEPGVHFDGKGITLAWRR